MPPVNQKCERVVRGSVASEHIVQLFDTHISRAKTVAAFLAEGLEGGDTVLVVARRRHWTAAAKRLKRQGCDLDTAIGEGHLVFLDAGVTLARFMRRGRIDPLLFEAVIGTCVSELAARPQRRLRIYGEMVDLLAEEANLQGARNLEELWNALAARYSFLLLCGYASAHFAGPGTRSALQTICDAHTHIETNADDALGNWVLAERHTPADGDNDSGMLHRELNAFRRARLAFQG
jgi:hypothetical protein